MHTYPYIPLQILTYIHIIPTHWIIWRLEFRPMNSHTKDSKNGTRYHLA